MYLRLTTFTKTLPPSQKSFHLKKIAICFHSGASPRTLLTVGALTDPPPSCPRQLMQGWVASGRRPGAPANKNPGYAGVEVSSSYYIVYNNSAHCLGTMSLSILQYAQMCSYFIYNNTLIILYYQYKALFLSKCVQIDFLLTKQWRHNAVSEALERALILVHKSHQTANSSLII